VQIHSFKFELEKYAEEGFFQQNWNRGFIALNLQHKVRSARAEGSQRWGISVEKMNFE
jgi:hypothetical protein